MLLPRLADGRDAPPAASPGAVSPVSAVSMLNNPPPGQGDDPQSHSAMTAEPRAEPADSPTVKRPVDVISTAEALHWFG